MPYADAERQRKANREAQQRLRARRNRERRLENRLHPLVQCPWCGEHFTPQGFSAHERHHTD